MVAVLKLAGRLLIAVGVFLIGGCHNADDANAPVANPPGRIADPTKDVPHPAGKKLIPLGAMKLNPSAAPQAAPGAKLDSAGKPLTVQPSTGG